MKTLHITGFADFLAPKSTGPLPNPSRLLLECVAERDSLRERLKGEAGAESVETHVFSVPSEQNTEAMRHVFGAELRAFLMRIDQSADAWLALGQGAIEQKAPRLEALFKNLLEMKGAGLPIFDHIDVEAQMGPGRTEIQALAQAVRGLGRTLEDSEDAGTFLCNWVGAEGYALLGGRARFVHLQTLTNDLHASLIWEANNANPLFRDKVSSRADLSYGDIRNNYETLAAVLRVWRPFDVKCEA